MRLAVVGADFEENLGVGMIAAAAAAGHRVEIVPFNDPAAAPELVRRLVAGAAEVIGLSIQFQHRAHEFLSLAHALRAAGFRGHLTAGGHFPTLAWSEVLGGGHGLDSLVLHEGEETIVELLDTLARGGPLDGIPGLALPGSSAPRRTAGRPILESLDELPFPQRYRPHARHLGVPFIPILGGRGCWGACTYCSITSFHRFARGHGGGKTLRLRSPENVAAEMALLWHQAGGPSIFCFHDDNLLLPRPADSLARLQAIRDALDGYGVGKIGLVGKCRPDCLTPELARALRRLGVIRLYVGVENAAAAGANHLNRRTQVEAVRAALGACREAGIFVCYNLLLFEPAATLDDIDENLAFIRAHSEHPVNFCRAEPYHGTPLHRGLAVEQQLGGSYLGWNYRIVDDRTELLFRIAAAAFRQRNFDPGGVGNRSMGLGYGLQILEQFHDDHEGGRCRLAARARDLTRSIVHDTADFLAEARELAATLEPSDGDRVERETALLGLRIAAADRIWHGALDALQEDLDRFAATAAVPRPRRRPPRALVQLAQRMALGASLGLASAIAASGCGQTVVDPVPPDMARRQDILVVDPLPPDMAQAEMMVVDPAPVDMALSDQTVFDPVPPDLATVDRMVVDPPPPDAGRDLRLPDGPRDGGLDGPKDGGRELGPVDPVPRDMARPLGLLDPPLAGPGRRLALVDQWRETAAPSLRTDDLPLACPPSLTLDARRQGDEVVVRLCGGPAAVGTRWEADGPVCAVGDTTLAAAREVTWRPAGADDQLRVAVRARGGVAVLALLPRDLERSGS